MKTEVFICATWNSSAKEWYYAPFSYNPSSHSADWILVEQKDVEFDSLADAELKKQLIAGLRKKKTALQAETQVELNALDERIQELLALSAPSEVV